LNAKGGINGEKVALILYDDGADANKARLLAQRLIEEDKVVAIIGSTLSGPSLAIGAVTSEAKIPLMALGGSVRIAEPVNPWVFKIGHTDRMACQKIFADLKARGLTNVGLVAGTDAFGNSMRTECLGQIQKYGVAVVADERHGPQDSDLSPQLTNVRSAPGIQAVVDAGFGETATVLARNFRQMNIPLPLYESHGVASPDYVKLTEPAAEGVRLPAPAILVFDQLDQNDPQRPVVVEYEAEYHRKYNEDASMFGGFAYDALNMLVAAYTANKSTDPVKARNTIEGLGPFTGVTGIFHMSATDHLGLDLSAFHMVEIKEGRFVLTAK
jgi:branched-chain amino acid transport system substrate-binding protein